MTREKVLPDESPLSASSSLRVGLGQLIALLLL
eukprot:CAMPEP_0175941098 /NCGR_PEP_ID=MMETSP0108-20121206/24200_1 /TAXON_ID=195067 ORGANISM="Goniomonas pacifica, Strain CCMP1869" /NCGR_SAMPLE_ID=MMETSP0108 /ASSEMBLY_ACC=CAM_ASM_000204 /LENGTH=32 /DNA_ID= /DNA_START= /DNA_END= /DNA_ORIENTATION=